MVGRGAAKGEPSGYKKEVRNVRPQRLAETGYKKEVPATLPNPDRTER